VTDHNNKPFFNGALSANVLKRYPELRQRSSSKKTTAVGSPQESNWAASANALAKLLK
jgi:hypothetical protein